MISRPRKIIIYSLKEKCREKQNEKEDERKREREREIKERERG